MSYNWRFLFGSQLQEVALTEVESTIKVNATSVPYQVMTCTPRHDLYENEPLAVIDLDVRF